MQLGFDLQAAPPAAPSRKIFSVGELTRKIRSTLEKEFGEVWVEGEISNLRKQASGHQYFTLKDATSQISCVLFAGTASTLKGLRLADGLQVELFGELTVYEPRGSYQIIARTIRQRGEGELRAKFEALKLKLAAQGLFDSSRKRPLPRFPQRVGLITSPSGAAIRDFLSVLGRRHPGIEVILNPVRVQGRGAAQEIARALDEFTNWEKHDLPQVDVVVLTRGGGSIEDLWEFNEEIVAEAIARSSIPVVSAVGHEIDFTIADFVADLRAPTPSVAAEILAADRQEVLSRLAKEHGRMTQHCHAALRLLLSQLSTAATSPLFREPHRRIQELRQMLDRAGETFHWRATSAQQSARHRLVVAANRIESHSPRLQMLGANQKLAVAETRLQTLAATQIASLRARFDNLAVRLATLDPSATLARGYTITTDISGTPLRSAKNIPAGAILLTRFADGEISSEAKS